MSNVLLATFCIFKREIYALLTWIMMCRKLRVICAIFGLKFASVLCFYAFPSLYHSSPLFPLSPLHNAGHRVLTARALTRILCLFIHRPQKLHSGWVLWYCVAPSLWLCVASALWRHTCLAHNFHKLQIVCGEKIKTKASVILELIQKQFPKFASIGI